MPTTLQIIGPDGIGLIDGTSFSSLDGLPPGGFALSDSKPNAALSITLSGSLTFSASSAGGATITQSTDAITISGNATEVNAALASLVLSSTVTGTTALTVSATDGTITTTTTLAVDTLADTPPAFLAPPSSLALTAGVASPIGLTLADDPAAALSGFGLAPETLTVTLLAGTGTLLLDAAAHGDVGISGDGTGTIVLTATSADLAGLNAALGAVLLDAAGPGTLEYVARQSGGPLADTVTSGSLSFTTAGSLSANGATWGGGVGNWQDPTSWIGGQVPGLATGVKVGTGALLDGYGVGGGLEFTTGALADIKAEAVTLAAIETGVPRLTEAREIIAAFQSMIRRKCAADLAPWLDRARNSLVASFAAGVLKDQAAIRMAITSPWSNGQTEGQITKLKLVKRQMYGRGKLDLLEARLIGPM